jgi:pullulanase/glycogen debranching enzyme
MSSYVPGALSAPRPAIRIGSPAPLGASITSWGVNFSLVAPQATRVELLLFASGEASQAESEGSDPDAPRGVDDDIVDADFEDLGDNKRK